LLLFFKPLFPIKSNVFKDDASVPENFELVISDGSSIPVPESSVDIIYSHQVIEHLHPDDAVDQLKNIYQVLTPGGIYICITPNRLSGPHDVSKHFDQVATGLHLKEYTVTELYQLFRAAGFSNISYYKSYQNHHLALPLISVTVLGLKVIETLLQILPYLLRREIASQPLLFRGITIIGQK
jgi:SAM-dependent methyltransferase